MQSIPYHCLAAAQLVALFCLLLSPDCAAQVSALNRLYVPAPRPPGIQYQVLSTRHFEIIFQEGAEREAREAAALLESDLPRAEALTGHRYALKMPVVLNAFNDRSNGLVATLPFRQEIETAPITGHRLSARYLSWMQAVVPHELVHATQAHSNAGFGIGSLLRLLSPDLARSLNLGLPPGLNEGAAVYHESTVQRGAGRLNFSLFQMQFRAAMASARPWSLAQLFEVPAYSFPRGRYYSGGANFFAHLTAADQGAFFRKAKALHYRWPFFGTGIELWYATGKAPAKLGKDFRQAARAQEVARQAALGAITEGKLLAAGPGRRHRRPQWINDSTLVAHISGYDVRTGFYSVDVASGLATPIAYEAVTRDAHFSLSSDGGTLLYSRLVQDRHVNAQWIADVFRLELATGKTKRITRDQRVYFPVQARGQTWAIQNQGQFTGWVRVTSSGELERVISPARGTVVQIAPSDKAVAVVIRQHGRQGIYRAQWKGRESPVLEPWIMFKDASIYDASWRGEILLFSADPGGVSNVFAAVGERVVQVTNVVFGAMEPALSPDGRTLAYVEYQHERFDLKTIPFDIAAAKPVARSELLEEVPPAPAMESLGEGTVVPYRAGRYLRPRTLLPDLLPSGDGSPWNGPLGIGPGLTLQGADPLRRWAYSLGIYVQSDRVWGQSHIATSLGGAQADAALFAEPGTALVLGQDRAETTIVGQETRGARLGLRIPVYAESNVRSTTVLLRLDGSLAANRLFALKGGTLPQVAPSWRRFKSRFTLSPSLYLQYRTTRNVRDLMPSSGASLRAWAALDLWDRRARPRRALVARAAQHFSLSARAHTGLRIRATMVAQNRAQIYDLAPFVPRGFEGDYLNAHGYVGLDGLVVQPLLFIDNGFVLLPVYLKVLYAYGFAEALYAADTDARYRVVGVGLGIQLRLIHYLDLELRYGYAYLVDEKRAVWTSR